MIYVRENSPPSETNRSASLPQDVEEIAVFEGERASGA